MVLKWLPFTAVMLLCLCLNAQTFQDCDSPFQICELDTYHFEEMEGFGDTQDILPDLRCISKSRFKETNSKWLYIEVEESGTLTFNIESRREREDIDFVLFETHEDCSDLSEVRCMASGKNFINTRNTKSRCLGNTGLNYTSLDDFEMSGCKYDDDNFLKFLSVRAGERYVLLVNNYDSKSGFSISFDGDCKLLKDSNCESRILDLSIDKLYPNPTTEVIFIQFNSVSDSYSLQILDATGKVYQEKKGSCGFGPQEIDMNVDNLLSGMYIIRISQLELNATKTFVKEN